MEDYGVIGGLIAVTFAAALIFGLSQKRETKKAIDRGDNAEVSNFSVRKQSGEQ